MNEFEQNNQPPISESPETRSPLLTSIAVIAVILIVGLIALVVWQAQKESTLDNGDGTTAETPAGSDLTAEERAFLEELEAEMADFEPQPMTDEERAFLEELEAEMMR